MLTTLEIEGLRGIEAGRIEDLAPLTILVGPNGSGKSTVLEAAGVACAGMSATAAFHALATREWLGLEGLSFWLKKDVSRVTATGLEIPKSYALQKPSAEVVVSLSQMPIAPEGAMLQVDVVIGPDGWRSRSSCIVNSDGVPTEDHHLSIAPFSLHALFVDRPAGAVRRLQAAAFSSALRDAIGSIKLSAWYDNFLTYLQVLRPDLTSIESIPVGDRDEPFMFESNPRRGYPIAYAGDGFRRALLVASSLARAKGGVAAMDEPEAFSHPRMFPTLANLIHRAVDDGTQVIFATHSLEFVEAALREFKDASDKACVVGLRMENGKLDPLTVSGPDAYQRVVEWKDDLRL